MARLVNEAPEVSVLVTSRTRLRLTSEVEFSVPPLDLPMVGASAAEIRTSDAVRLLSNVPQRQLTSQTSHQPVLKWSQQSAEEWKDCRSVSNWRHPAPCDVGRVLWTCSITG
ncbi:MAG: hypothetical protein R2839_06285 [Thermomicrobiales bacterium]